MPAPQRKRDLGHAHRHARVTALRGFDCIHRQRANRVGKFPVGGNSGSGHGVSDSVEGTVEAAENKRGTGLPRQSIAPRRVAQSIKLSRPRIALCNNPKGLQRSNP
jgi:hypothetical protein